MYVKVVDALNQGGHVFASPGATIMECDEISYTRFVATSKSEFDKAMAEYNKGYEMLGSEPRFDEKGSLVNCTILGLSTYHAESAVPSVRIIVVAGKGVYIMNDDGKTIDAISS